MKLTASKGNSVRTESMAPGAKCPFINTKETPVQKLFKANI